MAIITANKTNFDSLIESSNIVVLDFWASWCMPCKQFGKVFQKVSTHFPRVSFAKVNIEEEPELAELFHVRSIPHLVIIKDSIAIYSDAGSMPESTFRQLIEQAVAADVSNLKEQTEKKE